MGPGETYTYDLRFPDPGIFWYHPHVPQDYGQEQGLYGAILVEPIEPGYWAPVVRELPLVLDDILIEDGDVSSFDTHKSDHTLMGRFGSVMLANRGYPLRYETSRPARLSAWSHSSRFGSTDGFIAN